MNRKARRAASKTAPPTGAGDVREVARLAALAGTKYAEGALADCADALRKAARLAPREASLHANLAVVLEQLGLIDEAIEAGERAVALAPEDPNTRFNLAVALAAGGRREAAAAAFRLTVRLAPEDLQARCELAATLKELGLSAEAVDECRRAVALKPDEPRPLAQLAGLLIDRGEAPEAERICRRLVALAPGFPDAGLYLGAALKEQRRYDDAVEVLQRLLAASPNHPQALYFLAQSFQEMGRLDTAEQRYRQVLAVDPTIAMAYNNLGNTLQSQGRLSAARISYDRAIAIKADLPEAHDNLLMGLHYAAAASNAEIWETASRFGAAWDRASTRAEFPNPPIRDRRLRIGYVSADFRRHSVSYFLTGVLPNHDRGRFEVFCYSNGSTADEVTERLRRSADHWRGIHGKPDAEALELIRRDSIDILVDLSGHTAGNRLPLFAKRAAPVQVTWLGYPGTTGLATMDYRLVDAVTDPVGEADQHASETLVRLEHGFLCYEPMADAPQPASPPPALGQSVTFGSFNNPTKLSVSTLDAWSALLSRLPQAQLLLKGLPLSDEATRGRLLGEFERRGVSAARVRLMGFTAGTAEHLALYQDVDVALDPFPYNGTTTTCEALWMGVPVVTLRGSRHAARVGASLLGRLGLDELIAGTEEDYVAIAAALAGDPLRLAELRRSLRPRMAASKLCDGPAFARTLETAYRSMWRGWCEST